MALKFKNSMGLLVLTKPRSGDTIFDWRPFNGGNTLSTIINNNNKRLVDQYINAGWTNNFIEELGKVIEILPQDLSSIKELRDETLRKAELILIDLDAIHEREVFIELMDHLLPHNKYYSLIQISQDQNAKSFFTELKSQPIIPSNPEIIRDQNTLETYLIHISGFDFNLLNLKVKEFEEKRLGIKRSRLKEGATDIHATSDKPIRGLSEDLLGFEVYVGALRNFIISKYTDTPLTIGIDGPWGSGKSSLMLMLENELRTLKYFTIWFNSWRYDQEEKLWAALALEVTRQLNDQLSVWKKFLFWLLLTKKRLSLKELISRNLIGVMKLSLWFSILIMVWQYDSVKTMPLVISIGSLISSPLREITSDLIKYILGTGLLVTASDQAFRIIKDPFQISIAQAIEKPDYKEKMGFIGSFESDFRRVIEIATSSMIGLNSKIIIFIDDLDRCKPPKAVDILEAINLFLDSKGCVFVMGFDSNIVKASIDFKYQDVFEKTKKDITIDASMSRLFLDKIVQVPFHIPSLTKPSLTEYAAIIARPEIKDKTTFDKKESPKGDVADSNSSSKKAALLSKKDKNDSTIEIASYDRDDVNEAILKGISLLGDNIRQIKRFINIFRLTIYVADLRNLFEVKISQDQEIGLDLSTLSIWLAWSMRWPEVSKYMSEEQQLPSLRSLLAEISHNLKYDLSWDQQNNDEYFLSKIKDLKGKDEDKSNWSYLPWERLLSELDFLRAIKQMDCFWKSIQVENGDLLQVVMTMSRVGLGYSQEPKDLH